MARNRLNYRHLLYFWAVATEGTVTRAAQRLGLSAQTMSTQIGELEKQLGQALFAPDGRKLALTEAGRQALGYADQIFELGDRLCESLGRDTPARPRFAIGVTEAIPKLVAFRLLEPLLEPPLAVRLECVEGEFDWLLGELALNRLDLVIADRSAPQRANIRLHSHLLIEEEIDLYGSPELAARHGPDFPRRLDGAPLLLPARRDPLRGAIEAWFTGHKLHPEIIGEFTDSALLKTFGRAGKGLFPAPTRMHADLAAQFDVRSIGRLQGVRERWYSISTQRRMQHPAVALIERTWAGG